MTALNVPAYLLGRALGTLLRPLLRRVDAYVTPALDIDWSDPLTEDDDWPREFIQCPHEVIRATCVGCCNYPCGPCAPSHEVAT